MIQDLSRIGRDADDRPLDLARCRQEDRETDAVNRMTDALEALRGKGGGLRFDVDSTSDENTGEVWLYCGLSNIAICVDGDEAQMLGEALVAYGKRLIEIGKGQ